MKRIMVLVLALIMVFSALPVIGAYADETPEIIYTDHLTNNSDVGYDYDVTYASIAWVKQANGTLIWVPADDNRGDDEIIAQAKAVDASIKDENAVLKGLGTAETPNGNGSKATVTVSVIDGETVLSIEGKYSHFVSGTAEGAVPEQPAQPEETEDPNQPEETYAPEFPAIEGETAEIRIDTPQKMAVAFEDGTVCYGGEMKEFVIGQEYSFQMCSVNWDNGIFDGNENGLRGSVVYRLVVLHRDDFLAIARTAKEDTDRYTVKGMDVIDNVDKKIYVNCNAEDAHLETDVNNFFMAYRFHYNGEAYDKKTGIDKVVNTPVESLSVNLPLGSTISCKLYDGEEQIDAANVFVAHNSGEGYYDDEHLTSVNDYIWGLPAEK